MSSLLVIVEGSVPIPMTETLPLDLGGQTAASPTDCQQPDISKDNQHEHIGGNAFVFRHEQQHGIEDGREGRCRLDDPEGARTYRKDESQGNAGDGEDESADGSGLMGGGRVSHCRVPFCSLFRLTRILSLGKKRLRCATP